MAAEGDNVGKRMKVLQIGLLGGHFMFIHNTPPLLLFRFLV
jgi:hypothetical protein